MIDWEKIKNEYIAGGISQRALAQKHDVSYGTMRRRSIQEGWVELREQAQKKADAKLTNMIAGKKAKFGERLYNANIKLLERIENVLDDGIIPLEDVGALRDIARTLRDVREIGDYKSKADMREQEARIRNLEAQAQRQADDGSSKSLEVTIGDGLEDYIK